MMNVYVIRDEVSQQTTPLFTCPNDPTAVRQFSCFLQEIPTSWRDFALYEIGAFNPDAPELSVTSGTRLVERGATIELDALEKRGLSPNKESTNGDS